MYGEYGRRGSNRAQNIHMWTRISQQMFIHLGKVKDRESDVPTLQLTTVRKSVEKFRVKILT